MRECGACGVENPPTARFCMGCGTAMERRCPSCGEAAPGGARFCISCGTAIEGRADGAGQAAVAPTSPRQAEERRTVTVLFADLSGYTAVSERLDPEAVSEVADRSPPPPRAGGRALRRDRRQVHRRQRHGDLRRADGPRGRPRARGARRLRDAGRDGRDQCRRAGRATSARFQLRVGINTGEVLAGEVAGHLHRDGRCGERRRSPAVGRPARLGHRRASTPGARPATASSTCRSSR